MIGLIAFAVDPTWHPVTPRAITLDDTEVTFGRGGTADLLIESDQVGRKAGWLAARGGEVTWTDGRADAGSYVNQQWVGGRGVALAAGDRLRLGPLGFQVAYLAPWTFRARHLLETRFLAEIANEHARAVYADWLEARGDHARAAYLRGAPLDTDRAWRARVAHGRIEGCCGRGRWERATPSATTDLARACDACREIAVFCATAREARREIHREHGCAVLENCAPREPGDLHPRNPDPHPSQIRFTRR